MKTKAFTFVELMIVVVIIALLAAMLIPAFQKIRESSLVKAYEKGEKLDKKQIGIVHEYYKNLARDKTPRPATEDVPTSKTPILIPYDEVTEIVVNGEKFYAWSKK